MIIQLFITKIRIANNYTEGVFSIVLIMSQLPGHTLSWKPNLKNSCYYQNDDSPKHKNPAADLATGCWLVGELIQRKARVYFNLF